MLDDKSTDDSIDVISTIIGDDDRFHLITNNVNVGSSLENFIKGFDYINPADDDIIVRLDGDDWLSSVFVLEYLSQIYDDSGCWVTYGTYQSYPDGLLGDHQCVEIPDEVHENNSYRDGPHVYSHLRTHKSFLLKNVNRDSLKYPGSDNYFREAEDIAHMFPLIEMSGKDRIYRVDDILLILNRDNPNSVASKGINKQKETENIIRSMGKYKRLIK